MTTIARSPLIKEKRSTFSMMMELLVCLLVVFVIADIFYFLQGGSFYTNTQYGLYAIQNLLVGVLFSVIPDFIWQLQVFFKKSNEKKSGKDKAIEYFCNIAHSYSYISGVILVLLLPIGLEWYEIAISAVFAIFISKLVFGGFGSNIFNPAICGRVFAQLVFSSHMTTYLGDVAPTVSADLTYAIQAGSTIPGLISTNGFSALFKIPLWEMFLGNYYGSLGEPFAYLIIILAVYLAIRKIIDLRLTLTYIIAIYVSSLLMFVGFGADTLVCFEGALRYVFMGGVLFGGVFCITDPVTSPTSKAGKVTFALVAAFFTMIIRLYTASPEGVAYSILIANLLTPLIDKVFTGRTNKTLIPWTVTAVLFLAVLSVSLAYGFTNTGVSL